VVASQGSGKRFVLLARNTPDVPIQIAVAAFDKDGVSPKKQFRASEQILIQVALTNNSAQAISIKESELYDWLQLRQANDADEAGDPLLLMREDAQHQRAHPKSEIVLTLEPH
jgi:hypothetical protein